VDNMTAKNIAPILQANVDREARLLTDQAPLYVPIAKEYASHGFVNHSADEYVSAIDRSIHTNSVEGFFSVFKRGMKGVYQHCAHSHLNRYLSEFDFRYSYRVGNGYSDLERADMLLKGIVGKRLTYQTTDRGRGLA